MMTPLVSVPWFWLEATPMLQEIPKRWPAKPVQPNWTTASRTRWAHARAWRSVGSGTPTMNPALTAPADDDADAVAAVLEFTGEPGDQALRGGGAHPGVDVAPSVELADEDAVRDVVSLGAVEHRADEIENGPVFHRVAGDGGRLHDELVGGVGTRLVELVEGFVEPLAQDLGPTLGIGEGRGELAAADVLGEGDGRAQVGEVAHGVDRPPDVVDRAGAVGGHGVLDAAAGGDDDDGEIGVPLVVLDVLDGAGTADAGHGEGNEADVDLGDLAPARLHTEHGEGDLTGGGDLRLDLGHLLELEAQEVHERRVVIDDDDPYVTNPSVQSDRTDVLPTPLPHLCAAAARRGRPAHTRM